jgi:signal transduction histidine kinase
LHLLPSGAVLLALLCVTGLGWHNANQALNNELRATTANYANHTKTTIMERLNTYEVVLKGASGLFIASDNVNRQEWKSFVDSFDLGRKYPGIQGVGYTAFVPPEQVQSLTETVRADGYPDFHIFPAGQRDIYSATLYFEPLKSAASLGYDMYAEPARREAMVWAQATGEATLTRKLSFMEMHATQSGFTMYLPVYADATQHNLPATSRSVKGFTFAPFTASNLFRGIVDEGAKGTYGVRISDSFNEEDNILYETGNFASLKTDKWYAYRVPIEFYGRKWILDFRFSPDVLAETTRSRPFTTLISGTILSLMAAGFVLILLITRTRTLAQDKRSEVQSAKDELLSLASHQLRTPATAVKQYIGMLQQGFVGGLSVDQHTILEKAWDSNERQLHIINELLYVAKLDAHGIVLTPRKLDVGKLVKDIAQELADTAKEKKNKIRVLAPPRRSVYVQADEQCLRMALENLISNAIKYSHKSSSVLVKVTSRKDQVKIAITDKGVGIASDEMPLLFQRFSRIPNEKTRQVSGSGIGLYLAQQLVELHEGRIEVESVKRKGSTFTVYLPKKQTRP